MAGNQVIYQVSKQEEAETSCCFGFFSRRELPQTPPVPLQPTVAVSPQTAYTGRALLGPQEERCKGMKTLVLDLDETLVHSSFKPVSGSDFIVPVEIDTVTHEVHVLKRPGVDNFLARTAEMYELVVFTASLAKYANPVMDLLDPNGLVSARLFREACVLVQGCLVKDLSRLGRPITDVIIVDNSPTSYMLQPENAVPVTSWFDDRRDTELWTLLPCLEMYSRAESVIAAIASNR